MFELHCKDVGFDCAGVVPGMTKEALLQQAAAHAVDVHCAVAPALAATVKAVIEDCQSHGPEDLPGSLPPRGEDHEG